MGGTYHILLTLGDGKVHWHEESGLFAVTVNQMGDIFPPIVAHKDTYSEAVAWLEGFLYCLESA